jgi:membrane fusion protein, multidrug efflux system
MLASPLFSRSSGVSPWRLVRPSAPSRRYARVSPRRAGVLIGRVALGVCVLGLAALGGCKRNGQATAAPPPPVTVTTAAVQPQAWTDTIEALGTAKANESVTLTAKITETVRKVNFSDGQTVAAGDVLVELTSGQQVAALAEAQATARDATRQFERQQDLVRQGTISRAVFDTAQATRDSNGARVEALRAQLADRVVTAPFSGVLGLRQISPGALVTPGDVITTLDDISVVKVDFSLPEVHLAALAPGQTVVARSPAFPERSFEGSVVSLDSRVDPVTRAFQVRAQIPNPDRALRGGMLLTVGILRPEREALAVPEIALVQVGTEASVFKVGADQRVADRIVVDGTVKLRDGARVAEAAAPAGAERAGTAPDDAKTARSEPG